MNYKQLDAIRAALYEASTYSIHVTKDTERYDYFMSLAHMVTDFICEQINNDSSFICEDGE